VAAYGRSKPCHGGVGLPCIPENDARMSQA
jgi:hypothetical protein